MTMAIQVGKRYRCDSCNTEVLVTKPADTTLSCCGGDMPMLEPKKTGSAD
jgi:hypothetical protein